MNSAEPHGFLDIHSHILPGLDDGPTTFAQCLRTAEGYRAIGVDTVIATPHSIRGSRWNPTPEQVRDLAREVGKQLAEAGAPLRILPGMEIAVSDLVGGRCSPEEFLPLADSGVFLVEFPLDAPEMPGAPLLEQLAALAARKKRIIVAHPERCAMFQKDAGPLDDLVAAGAMLQVNIGSILGAYGGKARKTGLSLLESGRVHFLATDAHGRSDRTVPSPKQMNRLAEILGRDAVATAFHRNPRRLLNDRVRIRPLPVHLRQTRRRRPGQEHSFFDNFRRLFS